MNKKTVVSMIVLIIALLAGVMSASAADHKVGFLAPTLQTEFFITIDDGLKEGTAEKGWDYVSVSFDGDSAKAVTAIENMVISGCDAILAMVSDTSCDDALREAQAEGVKIIECGVQTEVYDACLNSDQYAIGEMISDMAGEWINAEKDGKANIVVYTTLQDQDMQNRGQGIQDRIVELCPEVNILEVVDIGKDIVGSGTSTTETMMQKYPDMDVIITYGDAAAVESVEAVKAGGYDPETFGIFSCDGTNAAMKYIKNGQFQRGTLMFDPIAPAVIDLSQRLFDGETFTEAIPFPINPITAANVDEYLPAE